MILNAPVIITLVIFFLTYGFIISEKINRTVVALIGASLILFANIIFPRYHEEHKYTQRKNLCDPLYVFLVKNLMPLSNQPSHHIARAR